MRAKRYVSDSVFSVSDYYLLYHFFLKFTDLQFECQNFVDIIFCSCNRVGLADEPFETEIVPLGPE